jgi:hypothetical protein
MNIETPHLDVLCWAAAWRIPGSQTPAMPFTQSQLGRLARTPAHPKVAVTIMVKNEIDTLPKTLRSVESIAHVVKLLDTGSTDKTMAFAHAWGEVTGIPVDITQAPFVNYAVSRNQLVNIVDEDLSVVCARPARLETRVRKFFFFLFFFSKHLQ